MNSEAEKSKKQSLLDPKALNSSPYVTAFLILAHNANTSNTFSTHKKTFASLEERKGPMSLSTSTCEWHGIWSYIPRRPRRISETWYLVVSQLRYQKAHFFAWRSVFLAVKKGRLKEMCFKIISCFGILVSCDYKVFSHFVLHLLIPPSISVLMC